MSPVSDDGSQAIAQISELATAILTKATRLFETDVPGGRSSHASGDLQPRPAGTRSAARPGILRGLSGRLCWLCSRGLSRQISALGRQEGSSAAEVSVAGETNFFTREAPDDPEGGLSTCILPFRSLPCVSPRCARQRRCGARPGLPIPRVASISVDAPRKRVRSCLWVVGSGWVGSRGIPSGAGVVVGLVRGSCGRSGRRRVLRTRLPW